MQIVKTLLIMAIIILSISFIMENKWIVEQSYEIQYYRYKTREIPLVLLFLGSIFFGALLVSIPAVIKNHRLKKALKTERKKIVQIEGELNLLRNLPISEENEHVEKSA